MFGVFHERLSSITHTAAFASLLLLAVILTACGKKGPPLAPLRLVPEAPADVSLRRVGDKAILRFTLPKKNLNGPGDVELDRVEIYALTAAPGAAAPPERELLISSHVVGTIEVKPPPAEDQPPDPKAAEDKRPSPGDVVAFSEDLTPATLTPAALPQPRTAKRGPGAAVPASAPAGPAYPVRIYVARGLTRSGRPGAATPRQQLPIVPLPPPPADAVAMFSQTAVRLVWLPPVGDLAMISGVAAALAANAQPAATAIQLETAETTSEPAAANPAAPGATANPAASGAATPSQPVTTTQPQQTTPPSTVARQGATATTPPQAPTTAAAAQTPAPGTAAQSATAPAAPQPAPTAKPAASAAAAIAAPPVTYNVYAGGDAPLNPAPLGALSFDHQGAEFGKEQCFAIGAIVTMGGVGIESNRSTPVCLTPRDIFPPEAPKGLAAVAGPGAIDLIWDANAEPDLGGYLVLRGEAPGDTLQPLMKAPIRDTHYTDTSVTPGVHYVYVVVAVDNATPPNESARTARVEETAR